MEDEKSVKSTQSMPIMKIKGNKTPLKAFKKLLKKKKKKRTKLAGNAYVTSDDEISTNSQVSTDVDTPNRNIHVEEAVNVSLLSNGDSTIDEDLAGFGELSGPPQINRITQVNSDEKVEEKKAKKQSVSKQHDNYKTTEQIHQEALQAERPKLFLARILVLSLMAMIYLVATRDPKVVEMVDKFVAPVLPFLKNLYGGTLGLAKSLLDVMSSIFMYVITKTKVILGLQVDLDGDILPLAKTFMGTTSDMPLKGVNAVVTRAASGVGLGVTMTLSQLGARVVAIDGSSKKLSALKVKAKSGSIVTVEADLDDLTSVSRAADGIMYALGNNVDILVNNGGHYAKKLGQTEQGYDKYFGGNYLSQFLLTEKFMEPLKRSSRGTIIQVSSMMHMLANGSDLEITGKRLKTSEPGKARNIFAYFNSLLATELYNNYLSRTQSKLHVASVYPRALTTPMRVSSVLHKIMEVETDNKSDISLSGLLSFLKEYLTPPSMSLSPVSNEDLQDDLYDWSQKAISPYLWLSFLPHSKEIMKEAVNEVIHPVEADTGVLFKGSVATLLSLGSLTLVKSFRENK